MDYRDCLERLYTANLKGIKLGLANMQAMLALLGSPHTAFESIHVAGTNGKGSTATKIAAALSHAGYKVGLYTSPHIASFRERIKLASQIISEQEVLAHLHKIFTLADTRALFLTFFEYTTCLALSYFAEEKVDIAVLECGLGGRLDATNICQPKLSIITSISLDHTELLGSTEDEIAIEKAGILKHGVPCVLGPRVPKQVMIERARELNCPLHFVEGIFTNYEEENCHIARKSLQVLSLPEKSIEEGLKALPPCRFQVIWQETLMERFSTPLPKAVILDVAHNPDGIQRLLMRLQEPFCVLCGFSKDKDISSCLNLLKAKATELFFVQAQSPRAISAEELCLLAGCGEAHSDFTSGILAAFQHAAANRQILVICGTFYIMSEARRFLCFDEVRDPMDLNERVARNVSN